MPAEAQPRPHIPRTRVLVLPLVELHFTLCVMEHVRAGGSDAPWADSMRRSRPDLMDRVVNFWGDDAPGESGELLVLAAEAGVVETERPEEAWGLIERAAERGLRVPDLPAEEPHVRPLLQDRIDRLQGSPELRQSYVSLVRELWETLEPTWESGAKAAAHSMAEQIRKQLASGTAPRDILPSHHFGRRETGCGPVMATAEARGELVIVPLGLGGSGIGLFSLPGITLAVFGPTAEQRAVQRREQAEAAATRFKLFSDPTRCSILRCFLKGGHSISGVADLFSLTQPTVSVHVKSLREAGLLESRKVRGQTIYTAPRERLLAFLQRATTDLLGEEKLPAGR